MRSRNSLAVVFLIVLAAGMSASVSLAQQAPSEPVPDADTNAAAAALSESPAATESSDAEDAPVQANLLRLFEKRVDNYAKTAVNAIASVLFWEFIGRRTFTDDLGDSPLVSARLKELIAAAESNLTPDEQKELRLRIRQEKKSLWTVDFARRHLSESDAADFDEELITMTRQVQPLVDKAAENVNRDEADFTLSLASGDLTETERLVVADALNDRFSGMPLRSFSVQVAESDATDQKRRFTAVNSGIPFIVAWLVAGAVFFTLRMRFINLRGFWHAVKVTSGKYDDPTDEGEVSHFQALTAALSATVGLGNIASVAIAVGIGGPGATFWMIVAGLLGMSSKFTECTLGQMYRQVRPDGRIMGGAMFYLSRGLKDIGLGPLGMILGVMFAVLCVFASFGGGNAFQVNQAIKAVQQTFGETPWLQETGGRLVLGTIMALLVGIVIIGGIRRIASMAEKIVPLMCGIYVLACLFILVKNAGAIPDAARLIVSSAFTPAAGYGAMIGVLVQGFRRAAFSNEAGVGSAAIAHSAAKTDYPAREGIVALLEPFIDTVVVCTMTALVIVITGAYDVTKPEFRELILSTNGAGLTVIAMKSQIWWFPYVLAVAVLLFAYSTMISWSYYGERCWSYLFGDGSSMVYRILFLICVILGSVVSATSVLDLSDLMILGMSFPNILGAVLLSGKVKRHLDDYWRKLKAGEFDQTPAT
ncbi:MAG: alanine/glycine:cation symporter family protein [Planctomycetaceae bacterium]